MQSFDNYGGTRLPYLWDEIKKLIKTKSTVTISPKVADGVNIADINIDGKTIPIYAPTGGEGTMDYSALTNKPQLEGVTLVGNKLLNEDHIHDYLTNLEIEDLLQNAGI